MSGSSKRQVRRNFQTDNNDTTSEFFFIIKVKLTVHNDTHGFQLTNGEESETGTHEVMYI